MRAFGVGLFICMGWSASATALASVPMPLLAQLPLLESAPAKARAASLFGTPDAVSRAMQIAMVEDLEIELAADTAAFAQALTDAEAGGGDELARTDGDGAVAFILGMFAGLGMGHFLIARQINRGLVWMGIDAGLLTLMIVFFVLTGPVLGGIFLALFVLERVVQGIDAMSVLSNPRFPFGSADPPAPSGRFASVALPFTPNVLSFAF